VREKERRLARRKLDDEMRPFRRAARAKNPTNALLRAVRQALRVPVKEIAEKMGVNRSVLFELEASEERKTITLQSMARVARAMGCKVVYGVVPEDGKTLEELAEERLWRVVLEAGTRDWGLGTGDWGLGTRD
jgi:transcriptional regulator with XRE-family HTH domain